ncbi:putative ABC transport system permease protein [Dysgonomonas alginatilytica]|uniref:Putative ABC transport system permease protein n=1 Tax=Dysgonomonas alginatilytica TaxID=1605892 RepID=A0A2V3PQY4_9BACT|nr:ABC transporter permease [Dysgonomonas alginatilytica]PXV66787.1 putative ABC transport system permease protein [Dysgonomonas alginatilytica]
MYNIPFVVRRFLKTKNLRIVNLLGLALMFACILVSYTYVKRELSFDKFYSKADRIVRMAVSYDGQQADGRMYGTNVNQIVQSISEIEAVLKLSKINTAILTSKGTKQVITDLYFSSDNLFEILDIPLLNGDSQTVFKSPGSVVISEKLAYQLFGKADIIGEKIELSGRRFQNMTCSIAGVFKDMPGNTHFHTDIIVREADFDNSFFYAYLLVTKGPNYSELEKKISDVFLKENPQRPGAEINLMPMADIHLHSHVLREMEPNGNIYYIYLIIGANMLLFIIVMFNLWLNASVIFSYNKRYYQLLRFNGASSYVVAKDEIQVVFWLTVAGILAGKLISVFVADYFSISFNFISIGEEIILCLFFLFITVLVSLFPVLSNISSTFFFNDRIDLKTIRFSFSNVKYMLVIQYSIVIFIIIVTLGINSQITLIRNTQVGGMESNIVVFDEQPPEIISNYSSLKDELLKHPEIESVTGAMQLPGSAVRDMIGATVEGKEQIHLPVLVVGEDFFPFYGIKIEAGKMFAPLKMSLKEEEELLFRRIDENIFSNLKEDIILNRKALQVLGFTSPEEAIGKEIKIEHSALDYTQSAVVSGVVDDFTYTSVYEDAVPMIILQRNMFMNCFMIRFVPEHETQAMQTLNSVWGKINPDYPINYKFLSDTYNVVYKNELNAGKVIKFFSVLCLIITILGLIVFMAFMIKTRTKEIGIRKVNGATNREIVTMLNVSLLRWILLSVCIAIPVAWFIIEKWLENFAYKADLNWWMFVTASVFVSLISLVAVSFQSWKAAKINPVNSVKSE